MKQAILELIDRKTEEKLLLMKYVNFAFMSPEEIHSHKEVRSLITEFTKELRSEIEKMDSLLTPEIDNFYEFSEGGEVWIAGRLMRYSFRSKEGGILSARHIRNIPPNN